MVAKVMEDYLRTPKSKLKYIHFNLHDTNLSNLLRFLGYWETHGYKKHVKFGSSVRLEVLKIKDQSQTTCKNENIEKEDLLQDYKIRIVYDDEEIKLPFCKELYCSFEEFTDHITENLMADLSEAEAFC